MDFGSLIRRFLPDTLRDTILVRLFGLWKVPLIAYVKPKVRYVDDERVEIIIPLRRRTKNHLGSMYFGSLMIGADLAAGYYAARLIHLSGEKIDFVFKASNARFLKRPTGDVVFTCAQGAAIRALVQKALTTDERADAELSVLATVPSEGNQVVAQMDLILSIKKRKRSNV
ncbi:MAG: DUF4442 domain-containing protein [Bdellovibrionota bacterium]